MVVGQMTALSACFFQFLLILLIKSCPKPEVFLRSYSADIEIISSFERAFFSLEPKLPPAGACWEEDSQRPSTRSLSASCIRAGTTSLLLDSSSKLSTCSPAEVIALHVTCCCGDALWRKELQKGL